MFVVKIEREDGEPSFYRFTQKNVAETFFFNRYISGIHVKMFEQNGENLRPVDVWTV